MTVAEIATHMHTYYTNVNHGDGTIVYNAEGINAGLFAPTVRRRYVDHTENMGSSSPFNLMQPYGVFPFAIRI